MLPLSCLWIWGFRCTDSQQNVVALAASCAWGREACRRTGWFLWHLSACALTCVGTSSLAGTRWQCPWNPSLLQAAPCGMFLFVFFPFSIALSTPRCLWGVQTVSGSVGWELPARAFISQASVSGGVWSEGWWKVFAPWPQHSFKRLLTLVPWKGSGMCENL